MPRQISCWVFEWLILSMSTFSIATIYTLSPTWARPLNL